MTKEEGQGWGKGQGGGGGGEAVVVGHDDYEGVDSR